MARSHLNNPVFLEAAFERLRESERSRWGRRMRALQYSGDPLAMANPDGAPSMHDGQFPGFGAFAQNANVQIFTPLASAQAQKPSVAGVDGIGTWDKPRGAKFVLAIMQGAGAGAGSGRLGAATAIGCGGGGGGGGNLVLGFFFGDDLSDEIPYNVAAGGPGGAAQATLTSNGLTPAAPNPSGFGSNVPGIATGPVLMYASPGGPGGGGTTAAGVAGTATNFSGFTFVGGAGAAASTTGTAGTTGSTAVAGSGGSSGGGLTAANATSAGGNAPRGATFSTNASGAGTAGGGIGASGSNGPLNFFLWLQRASVPAGYPLPNNNFISPGSGGAGGGSSASAAAGGAGGNGFWGGGGGGGGAATNSVSPSSGPGGNGGDSFLMVVSW